MRYRRKNPWGDACPFSATDGVSVATRVDSLLIDTD